jgi:hypothetical protein
LNLNALSKVKDPCGEIYVYNIFEKSPEMLNKYDGIFLLDVIEHIKDDRQFLTSALEHIPKGGMVLINVPALKFLFSKYDKVAGHHRRYTIESMDRLLRECGVEPVKIGYWGLLLLPIAWARKIMLLFISEKETIKSGFKPYSRTVNNFLKLLMKVELTLFRNPFVGTSVFSIGRKN